MLFLMNKDGEFLVYFQYERALSHYGICMRCWLDQQFPDQWIGHCDPME